MEPELVHLIEVEPAVVQPDGRVTVRVECVGDPERRPQSAPYGWVRLMLRQDDEIRGLIDRQVTRDQWLAEANEFTIEIDLREQLPPGELTVTAACHDVCCGWVKGPVTEVADYDDGPSIFASEPLAVGVSFDQLPPRRGESANVTASCPAEASVGNAQIRLLTNDDPNNEFNTLGMDSYGVIQVVDVAADAYQPGDSGQLTFAAPILIPDDAPSIVAVYVSCLRARGDWTPGVRMTPNSQLIPFDVSP